MANTDLQNLQLVQDADDVILNNGVADDSITPNVDNGLRSDNRKTLAFFGSLKWTINTSGVPTSGQITLNNDFDTATSISIFKTDAHGKQIEELLALIDSGVVLFLGDYEGYYGSWAVTGKTDNTTYFTYTVKANANNPSYTPQGLEGVMTFFGGAGGGGGGASIMTSNNTMTANQTQTMTGFIQAWLNGTFSTLGTDINFNQGDVRFNEAPVISNEYSLGNTSTALSIDLSKGNYFTCTATDNFTLSFSNAPATIGDMQSGQLRIVQDGTGSRVLTLGANVISQGGVTPLLTTTASATDVLYFEYRQRTGELFVSVTNDWK